MIRVHDGESESFLPSTRTRSSPTHQATSNRCALWRLNLLDRFREACVETALRDAEPGSRSRRPGCAESAALRASSAPTVGDGSQAKANTSGLTGGDNKQGDARKRIGE